MSDTPFVETEFLLAVMNDDDDEQERLLVGMLPGERATLHAMLYTAMATVAAYEHDVRAEAAHAAGNDPAVPGAEAGGARAE